MNRGQVGWKQDRLDECRTSWMNTGQAGWTQDKLDEQRTGWMDTGQPGWTQDNLDEHRISWMDTEQAGWTQDKLDGYRTSWVNSNQIIIITTVTTLVNILVMRWKLRSHWSWLLIQVKRQKIKAVVAEQETNPPIDWRSSFNETC